MTTHQTHLALTTHLAPMTHLTLMTDLAPRLTWPS